MQQIPFETSFGQFSYKLIDQKSIQVQDTCNSIAIKHDNSILLTSAGSSIKVFELHSEGLKYIQSLKQHAKFISTLQFLKKKFQIISGSWDSTIRIWSSLCMSQPKCLFKLKGHSKNINCLLLDPQDNLIVSGSDDRTIKFWIPSINGNSEQQWTCVQTIQEHISYICELSINQEGNKIISCGKDSLILVIENDSQIPLAYSPWIVKQKIKIDGFGYSICFIQSNIFVFQPREPEPHNRLQIYTIDNKTNSYMKNQNEVSVRGGGQHCSPFFPSIYNQNKSLLLIKNGHNINILKITPEQTQNEIEKNGEEEKTLEEKTKLILQQAIDFGNDCDGIIFGTLSYNGEYLITWDQNSKQIQIRKYIKQ